MVLDEPPFRAGRRTALKICPVCHIKMLLEARDIMYAHMRYHMQHMRHMGQHNERTHRCRGFDSNGRGCRELFTDKEQLIDHMLNTHSPILMVPTSSKTYGKAYHLTETIGRRLVERAVWN
jgi:hypothetical protein